MANIHKLTRQQAINASTDEATELDPSWTEFARELFEKSVQGAIENHEASTVDTGERSAVHHPTVRWYENGEDSAVR